MRTICFTILITISTCVFSQSVDELIDMGIEHFDFDEMQEAKSKFKKAIELKNDEHYAWFNLGLAYIETEDYDSAIVALDKAVYYDENNQEYYLYRGIAQYKNYNYKDALSDFEKAVKANPGTNEVAYYYRGVAKGELYDSDGAIIDFNKALEINPEFVDAIVGRAYARFANGDIEGACRDWSIAGEMGHPVVFKVIREYCF